MRAMQIQKMVRASPPLKSFPKNPWPVVNTMNFLWAYGSMHIAHQFLPIFVYLGFGDLLIN